MPSTIFAGWLADKLIARSKSLFCVYSSLDGLIISRKISDICAQNDRMHLAHRQRVLPRSNLTINHLLNVVVSDGVHSGLLWFPQRRHHGQPAGPGAQVRRLGVRRHEHHRRSARLCRCQIRRLHSRNDQELVHSVQSNRRIVLFRLCNLFLVRHWQENCQLKLAHTQNYFIFERKQLPRFPPPVVSPSFFFYRSLQTKKAKFKTRCGYSRKIRANL